MLQGKFGANLRSHDLSQLVIESTNSRRSFKQQLNHIDATRLCVIEFALDRYTGLKGFLFVSGFWVITRITAQGPSGFSGSRWPRPSSPGRPK